MDESQGVLTVTCRNIAAYEGKICEFAELWSEDFWQGREVVKTLNSESAVLLVLSDIHGKWLGILLLQIMPPLSDLLYIYVAPSARGNGFSRKLLTAGITFLKGVIGIERLLLEVKPNNHAALRLYETIGFVQLGRRARYYQSGEDALLYAYELQESDSGS